MFSDIMFKVKSANKLRLLVSIFLAILLGFSLNSASAVNVGLKPTNVIDLASATACMSTIIATGADSSNNFTVSGVNLACLGQTFLARTVTLNGLGEVQLGGTITASLFTVASPVVISPSNVIGVKFTINGWNIPASWTYQAPTLPPIFPNPATPGVIVNVVYNQTNSTQVCATITVSTNSATPITWSALLNIAVPPFNGANTVGGYQLSPNIYRFNSAGIVNGFLTIEGRQPVNRTIVAGSPRVMTVCHFGTPPPPPGRSTDPNIVYSQTETTPAPSFFVCKTVTVSTTGSPTFFVGWDAIVDVSNLQSNFQGVGGFPRVTSGGFLLQQQNGNVYRVTGNGFNTTGVRDNAPINFNICWGN